MIRKEILMYFIVYNTIKILASEGTEAGINPDEMSFNSCRQVLNNYVLSISNKSEKELRRINHAHALLSAIKDCRLFKRAGRVEPRVVKRRPKPFRLMTKPRAKLRAELMGYELCQAALT